MSNADDHDHHDDTHEEPGANGDSTDKSARDFLIYVGFDDDEATEIMAMALGPGRTAYLAIQRLATRVNRMEEYLERKAKEARASRIIVPGREN